MKLIEVSDLQKHFAIGNQTIKAIKQMSFTINQGEFISIMGPSGSGKTTLMNIIGCLDSPTSGSYSLDNNEVASLTDDELAEIRNKKIGFVFQSFHLLARNTALQNVLLPLSYAGFDKKSAIEKAKLALSRVGLEDRMDHKPSELSGGQQQRVGIARSLAVEPDIWFLDEPFSALDPLIRKEMQDEFLRLQGVLNKTIMFVTHDFDEALRLADRIAIMKDGIIEQLDTPGNIVLNPATDYVKKFTEDVPREKVLRIESIMDAQDPNASDTLEVSKDDIIETVAEKILNSKEIIKVTDPKDKSIVGSINPSKVIKVLFGG